MQQALKYYLIEEMLFYWRNYTKALQDIDKSLLINPINSEAYFVKALSLQALRQFEESLKCLDIALSFNPKWLDVLFL